MEKKNAKQAVERLKILYANQGEDRIFAHTPISVPEQVKQKIEDGKKRLNPEEFPDIKDLFPLWDAYLSCFNDLEDDWLPSIYPRQYDMGIYGTMFDPEKDIKVNRVEGEGWFCSMTEPFEGILYETLISMDYDSDNSWIKRMRNDLKYLSEKSQGRWGVAAICTVDALNYAVHLRGSDVYLDIFDSPDDLKLLLESSVEVSIKFVEMQRAAIHMSYEGGVYDFFNAGWMPEQSIPMSVDAYSLCQPRVYTEYGLPFHQKFIDHFGGGNFHIHGNGRHTLSEMAEIKGLVVANIGDDGSKVRAFDDLENIKQQAGSIVPVINCQKEEFLKGIKDKYLLGGVFYGVSGCDSVFEANKLMEKVRSYQV